MRCARKFTAGHAPRYAQTEPAGSGIDSVRLFRQARIMGYNAMVWDHGVGYNATVWYGIGCNAMVYYIMPWYSISLASQTHSKEERVW